MVGGKSPTTKYSPAVLNLALNFASLLPSLLPVSYYIWISFFLVDTSVNKPTVLIFTIYAGNRQKKANALIEASGLRMIAVEDFDKAAQTVSTQCQNTICSSDEG